MIIHNPIVSGSLRFPSDENDNLITLQVVNGTLETLTLNSSGVNQNIQPAVNYSGSFTGSFTGDGSQLTGIAATSFNIDALDALGGVSVAQDDNFLISDAGTEKKVTFSNLEDSIFANVSGDISIAAGGSATLGNAYINTSLNAYTASNDTTNSAQDTRLNQLASATGSYLTTVDISSDTNLAVSDTTNVDMILSGDTLSANLKGGVVSGSSQIDGTGISNNSITISGTSVSLGSSITDETLFGGVGVVTGSAQISHDSTTGFVANEHIDHSSVSITAGTGLNGGGTIAATRTLNVDSDYKNDSLNTFTASLSTNLADLTDAEVAQLENIGTTTISSTQWGYLGASNQGITTTSNVQFANLTLSGDLTVNGETSYISSSVVQIGDNILELNGSAGANGGIYVRDAVGTTNSGSLLWDTSNDYWKAGAKGSENEILTTGNVDSDIKTLSLPSNTTISSFGKTLVDDADASAARTTLGVDASGTDNSTDVTIAAGRDYITISGQELTLGVVDISDDTNLAVSDTTGQTGINLTLSGDTLSGVVSGLGTGDDVTFGTVRVDDATASTSKTTGALIVDGGVGIGLDLNVGGDVVAYASSDERLKDNIELISNPIEKVQSLKGVTWNWNDNASETQKSTPNVGVIAQDVEKVLPQLVHDRDNGFKGVDYAKLTGLLIEAIKDQQKQIDELKSKLS